MSARLWDGIGCPDADCGAGLPASHIHSPLSAKPVAVMMGTATITRPLPLHTYFMRNCSSMTYHRRLNRIRLIWEDRAW